MNKKVNAVIVVSSLLLSVGCATSGKSILLGGAVGAGVGAGLGNLVAQDTQGTLIGAASGAALGGLLGYLDHKQRENKVSINTAAGIVTKPSLPFLTRPEVRSIWEPDKIEGDRYIQGHYIFIIQKQSTWTQP